MKNQVKRTLRCLPTLLFAVILAGHTSAQLFWAGAGLDPATAGSGTWDNANMQWSSAFPTYTAATWNIANGTGNLVAASAQAVIADGKFNGFGDLCLTQDNRLLLVYREGSLFAGTAGIIQQKVSTDYGKTFGPATTIYQDTTLLDSRDICMTQLSDGRLAVTFFKENARLAPQGVFIMFSSDDGKTWGTPKQLPTSLTSFAAASARIVQRNDGVYLLPVYGKVIGDTKERAQIYQSTDKGVTWSLLSTVAGTGSDSRYTEHYLGYLPDKKTLMDLVRNDTNGTLYRTISTDGGATWSALATMTGLSNWKTSRPSWIALPSGGIVLKCRTLIGAGSGLPGYATSWDNGLTWTLSGLQFLPNGYDEYGGLVLLQKGLVAAAVFAEPSGFYTHGENGTRSDGWIQFLNDGSSPSGKSVNFNGTGGGTVTIGASIVVNDINFGANAGAFTLLNSGSSQSISFFGTGITNNSANTEGIINSGTSSSTVFFNSATAANASITNSGSNSFTEFRNSATAANASITNSGSNSFTEFRDSASGGNASLINANPTAFIDISRLIPTGTIAGSIAGNGFLNLGSKNLAVGGNNTSTTFSGVIRDGGLGGGTGGTLTKVGTGALILSGTNTYSGNTFIQGGVLQVDGSIASPVTFVNLTGTLSGNGSIGGGVNNAGVVSPGDSPGTLTINGDYGQQSVATLRIEIAGLAPAQHDLLSVGGSASLAGTLQVIRLDNFMPAPGNEVTIITDGGGHSGTFSNIDGDFPGLIQPVPQYDRPKEIRVVFELSNTFLSQGFTRNQKSVAEDIDDSVGDSRADPLIAFLGNEPLSNLPHDFDLIAPEELASIYEISFSQAVVQADNLQRRMDDIRAGSTGFCAAGYAPQFTGQGYRKGSDGETTLDKYPALAFAPSPENRWGIFVTGTGDFVSVGNNDDNAHGYDIVTGGVTLGVDYRMFHNFALGIYGGYDGSTADLVGRGRLTMDGGNIGAFATYFCGGFYVDAAGGGGWNNYNTRRDALLGDTHGITDGSEVNALVATGYDWRFGCLNIGPTASFQYTNARINRFSEEGSLAPLEIQDQDEDSLRSTVGMRASYDIKTGHGMIVRPDVRVAWLHEYGDQAYPISSRLVSGAGDVFTVWGPTIGRDGALVGAGVNVQYSATLSIYVAYSGVFDRSNYDNNGVSGGFRLSF